ncbi:hypothetical protein [Streptomyces sp. PR69]|uniref:hypothetical protein n=1 Tax=Streptomyces sp. PR69 TaxID=2984950 RepID=UPI0022651F38|nr:hypothetical protein [Streptomyces sp. PR69]
MKLFVVMNFIEKRRKAAGPGYAELIRLLKGWIRQSKLHDPDLRCKSFLLELLVAHLEETGWNGEKLQVDDYPRAIEQVLSYIVRSGLQTPVVFTDYYTADHVAPSHEPIRVWDPVNPANNVAGTYLEADRLRLVDHANTALEAIAWAACAPTKGDANDAWRELFGPTFQGA